MKNKTFLSLKAELFVTSVWC